MIFRNDSARLHDDECGDSRAPVDIDSSKNPYKFRSLSHTLGTYVPCIDTINYGIDYIAIYLHDSPTVILERLSRRYSIVMEEVSMAHDWGETAVNDTVISMGRRI